MSYFKITLLTFTCVNRATAIHRIRFSLGINFVGGLLHYSPLWQNGQRSLNPLSPHSSCKLTTYTSTWPYSQMAAQIWTLIYWSLNTASSRAPTGHSAERLITQGNSDHVATGKGTELSTLFVQVVHISSGSVSKRLGKVVARRKSHWILDSPLARRSLKGTVERDTVKGSLWRPKARMSSLCTAQVTVLIREADVRPANSMLYRNTM